MRHLVVGPPQLEQYQKDFLARSGKDDLAKLSPEEQKAYKDELEAFKKGEIVKYRQEAKDYFRKLVESYPTSQWAVRARKSLQQMG
jgi:hypothetical protein